MTKHTKAKLTALRTKPKRKRSNVAGKGGGGGAYRAFVIRRCKGICRFSAYRGNLSQEYHALSPEEKQELVNIGARVTKRHKRGLKSFGEILFDGTSLALVPSTLNRLQNSITTTAADSQVGATSTLAVMMHEEALAHLQTAKADKRLATTIENERLHYNASTYQAWKMASVNVLEIASYPNLGILHRWGTSTPLPLFPCRN